MKIRINDLDVWVNYHHLYCFFVIANEGSLVTASEALSIGASALSIQMKVFEQNLGIELFDRKPRKLQLNENGQLLYSYAKEIFRLGAEMIEVLHDKPAPGRTHLQIGALDTIPKHLTLQLMKAALNSGKCSVALLEGHSAELLSQLKQHRIDLVLTNSAPSATLGKFVHRRIARLPLWIVGSKAYLPLKKDFPASLKGQPFVMPTGESSVRQDIDSFFKTRQIEPDVVCEAQDVMVQKLIALEGLGLTVAPEFAIREFLDSKRLFLIGRMDEAHEELFLVSASRKIENPVAKQLMKNFKVQ